MLKKLREYLNGITLRFITRLIVMISYLGFTVGIPIYLTYPLFKVILNMKDIIGFLAYMGYGICFIFWFMFCMAIFGYAVTEEE